MSQHLCLAPLLESYFRRRLAKQRNATPATLASYRVCHIMSPAT
jgi:hypothetical protein